MKFMGKPLKNLPTLLTAFGFALAVWIFAITQADPTETRAYPRTLEMEIIGLDPSLMISNIINGQVSLSVRAPSSILAQLERNSNLIHVTLDLSGLSTGVHNLKPQVNIGLSPAEVVQINPSTVSITLDSIVTEEFLVNIETIGNPAIGFEITEPVINEDSVFVSGPQDVVESVDRVVGEVNIVDVAEDIERTIDLRAINSAGNMVEGVRLNPSNVHVLIPVVQRGGYRTVVVKIATSGQIAAGYRLTNIFAMPPTVTIYSSNPRLVEGMPGFIETAPINLNGANQNLEIRVSLNLPEGINVVGSQNVTVQVGLEPIESSINFASIPVEAEGLDDKLTVSISPESVDVFLSGPLTLLEKLDPTKLRVLIDLVDRGPGTYQLVPEVVLEDENIHVDAILPNTLEVTITKP